MKQSQFLSRILLPFLFIALAFSWLIAEADEHSPSPLLSANHPVTWWFVFKFNAATFPKCGDPVHEQRQCTFGGGEPQHYSAYSQQYVYASSENPSLLQGNNCAGDQDDDPVGATFGEAYNGHSYYVVWNDQFYNDPVIQGCGESCAGPWGHSKGMLVWNDQGDGYILQVTTPSWPASGNGSYPRQHDGNTLGCVEDNNVKVSQHFFALKLNHEDILVALHALNNASIVTDVSNPQIVNNGGPEDVQQLVRTLGHKSTSKHYTNDVLSSGIRLISKSSAMNVPPWQMVSSLLGSIPLRSATWWAAPRIPSTTNDTEITCWDSSLPKPGSVEIATTGEWNGKSIGLKGGPSPNSNHAKIGVSNSPDHHYTITGDLNQQGALAGNCKSSQNGRGGLFFVIDNDLLHQSVSRLISGDTATVGSTN